jgi:hypothetical protein
MMKQVLQGNLLRHCKACFSAVKVRKHMWSTASSCQMKSTEQFFSKQKATLVLISTIMVYISFLNLSSTVVKQDQNILFRCYSLS